MLIKKFQHKVESILYACTPSLIISKKEREVFEQLKYTNKDSFSQEREDLILNRIFKGKSKGFYVDIGAHHTQRFSNTCMFYQRGWHGINIDAQPGSMELFNKERLRDINIERAISYDDRIIDFYQFNEPALNTFYREKAIRHDTDANQYHIVNIVKIKTETLNSTLDEYLPANKAIDFLTIDTEGYGFRIIKSIDFEKYKPKVIVTECQDRDSFESTTITPLDIFRRENGYFLFSKLYLSKIFALAE
jgi:FkbM family methyltransferase